VDERSEDPTTRRWWKKGTWAAVCLVAAAGIALWATGSSASATSGYRTAEATVATVRQTLSVSGTTEPVHQATAEFQVAGTVSSVDVSVGQKVSAGQTLASLDTTSLAEAVSSAQLSVSAAEAALTENEAGESAGSSSAGSTGDTASATLTADVTSTTGGGTPTTGTSGATGGTTAQSSVLTADQQGVVAAQKAEDADAATAAAAFAQAEAACSSAGGGTTTTSSTPSTTTTTAPSDPSGSSTACTDALSRSLTAQQQVTTDQKAVASAESTLAQALSALAKSSAGSSSSSPSSATGGSSSTTGGTTGNSTKSGSATAGTAGTGSSTTGGTASQSTDTPEQLASDQAAIDTAEATLIEAQQSQADAQLTSPIGGTVVAVSLATGQSVTAGSTTDIVTIVNSGSYQITSSLTSTQASQVKVGDSALVTVDGENGTLTGTVARVGPVDTSGSSDTYPLIVALPAGSRGIADGSTAQVQVVLHEVVGTLSVPTSSVHVTGAASGYVDIVQGGQLVRKKVTIGAIGGSSTQITSGISAGTAVVLADLSEAVPSSSASTSTRTFGGGGLSGAGGGPGGGGFGG
jgi:HlyD family secretion protein